MSPPILGHTPTPLSGERTSSSDIACLHAVSVAAVMRSRGRAWLHFVETRSIFPSNETRNAGRGWAKGLVPASVLSDPIQTRDAETRLVHNDVELDHALITPGRRGQIIGVGAIVAYGRHIGYSSEAPGLIPCYVVHLACQDVNSLPFGGGFSDGCIPYDDRSSVMILSSAFVVKTTSCI